MEIHSLDKKICGSKLTFTLCKVKNKVTINVRNAKTLVSVSFLYKNNPLVYWSSGMRSLLNSFSEWVRMLYVFTGCSSSQFNIDYINVYTSDQCVSVPKCVRVDKIIESKNIIL